MTQQLKFVTAGQELDIEHLSQWIGREETAFSEIDTQTVARFRAVFEEESFKTSGAQKEDGAHSHSAEHMNECAPLGLQWCLFNPILPVSSLTSDGHPPRGDFLPPVALPRRMWAGGQLTYHDDFKLGDKVEKKMKIENVTLKHGKSGPLVFVSVRHNYHTQRGLVLDERQDIVYRAMSPKSAPPPAGQAKMRGNAQPTDQSAGNISNVITSRMVVPSEVLLFRYSVLMENAHRIHYDRAYATEVEGYKGLVVQGPLQATYLAQFARKLCAGQWPLCIDYRGVQPLFDGPAFSVKGRHAGEATAQLWTENHEGQTCMRADVKWGSAK